MLCSVSPSSQSGSSGPNTPLASGSGSINRDRWVGSEAPEGLVTDEGSKPDGWAVLMVACCCGEMATNSSIEHKHTSAKHACNAVKGINP